MAVWWIMCLPHRQKSQNSVHQHPSESEAWWYELVRQAMVGQGITEGLLGLLTSLYNQHGKTRFRKRFSHKVG